MLDRLQIVYVNHLKGYTGGPNFHSLDRHYKWPVLVWELPKLPSMIHSNLENCMSRWF